MSSAAGQDRELSETSTKLAQQISQSGKRTIAVGSIANAQNYGPQFSDYVADQLSTFLAGAGKGFDVVTRSRLTQIMDERRLKFGSSFDTAAFQQLGKLAGADAIIGGSYRVLGSIVSVNLQILDVSRGTIIAGTICSIPRTKDVDELLGTAKVQGSPDSPKDLPKDAHGGQSGIVLPPSESFHSAELGPEVNGVRFGSYKCKRNSETVICYFLVTRTQGGNFDFYPAHDWWTTKLIDNFNAEHVRTQAYIVTGKGQPQKTVSLGSGDTAWFAIEFARASPDITSARVVFVNYNFQLHARVE
jgi:TolB-like protein